MFCREWLSEKLHIQERCIFLFWIFLIQGLLNPYTRSLCICRSRHTFWQNQPWLNPNAHLVCVYTDSTNKMEAIQRVVLHCSLSLYLCLDPAPLPCLLLSLRLEKMLSRMTNYSKVIVTMMRVVFVCPQ